MYIHTNMSVDRMLFLVLEITLKKPLEWKTSLFFQQNQELQSIITF